MYPPEPRSDRGALARRFAGRLFQDSLFDRMFEDLLARWPGALEGQGLARPVDVEQTDEGWTVRCELPGYDPEDVKVELSGDVLTIRAEVDESQGDDGARARRYASFEQQVPLGGPIDADRVRAEHRHGVLTISLPRREASEPRRISIARGQDARAAEPSKAGPAGPRRAARASTEKGPGPRREEGQVGVPEEWEPPQT